MFFLFVLVLLLQLCTITEGAGGHSNKTLVQPPPPPFGRHRTAHASTSKPGARSGTQQVDGEPRQVESVGQPVLSLVVSSTVPPVSFTLSLTLFAHCAHSIDFIRRLSHGLVPIQEGKSDSLATLQDGHLVSWLGSWFVPPTEAPVQLLLGGRLTAPARAAALASSLTPVKRDTACATTRLTYRDLAWADDGHPAGLGGSFILSLLPRTHDAHHDAHQLTLASPSVVFGQWDGDVDKLEWWLSNCTQSPHGVVPSSPLGRPGCTPLVVSHAHLISTSHVA